MPNNKITIVGCGYIGKQLAQQLLKKQISAAGFVSCEASLAECKAKNIACQIINLDLPLPDTKLAGHSVIYLVPPPRIGKIDTRIENFLRSIKNCAPDRLVLISTTGVYGDCHGEWIDESTPINPQADRAHRRANAEQQVRQFCQHLKISLVILRVAGIYGPGKLPQERIKSGQPIVNQQESPFTNRIHADDLVSVCETALLNANIIGTYNVSDGHPGSMYEYFIGVAAALNLPAPPAISLQQARTQLSPGMLLYMDESRRINNTKLLHDFGITLRYPDLQSALATLKSDL